MLAISDELRAAIKLHDEPAYKIAHKSDLDPTTLSRLVCGISRVKHNDPRIIRVGRTLGLPAERCFQEINS